MMDIYYTKEALKYNVDEFPEGTYRLEGIGRKGKLAQLDIDPRPLIFSVHSPEQLERVRRATETDYKLAQVKTDENTLPAALKSAVLAKFAAEKGGFSAGHPPGHHAEPNKSKGYCIFNNMAIVAQSYLDQGKKVCIIDFDGHQGDGTEAIFYENDQVLFLSIHQEFEYPYRELGYPIDRGYDLTVDRHGKGKGEGFTYNMPVPHQAGDDIFITTLERFGRVIKGFLPDVIGISAGFDGYMGDALLGLRYTKNGFWQAGKTIASYNVPVFGLLEGGYHSRVIDCIECFAAGINNRVCPSDEAPSESGQAQHDRFRQYLDLSGIG